MGERSDTSLIQWAAVGALALLAIGFSVTRIPMADVPWQLATGRMIVEEGVLPTTNTFSWTHADFPLYQQSPLYQVMLFGVWRVFGFAGLSVLTGVLWSGALVVWMRWAGTWRDVASHSLLWVVAIFGVQRHLLLRPEVMSVLFLGLLLLFLDRFRLDHRWRWIGAAIGVQWMWANSHQLFAIGLAVQFAFVIHLLLTQKLPGRLRLLDVDQDVPLVRALLLLGGSVLASCATPLGFRSLLIPLQSIGTLVTQGGSSGVAQTAELAPVWTDPIAFLVVVVALAIVVYSGVRSRGRWLWLEIALLALGIGLVLAALRGIGFFSLLAIGVSARWFRRVPANGFAPYRRLIAPATTVLLCGLAFVGFVTPNVSFWSVQSGTGRAIGEWPDETIEYLNGQPPGGPILNVGWAAANVLIWEGYEVFVGPRWEAYPKPFLLESIEAMGDVSLLSEQIDEWQPAVIVAELYRPEVQETMANLVRGGEWKVVHMDVLHLVLVRGAQDHDAPDVLGWHADYPTLFAQEKVRVACWFELLGEVTEVEALRVEARELIGSLDVSCGS